MSDNPLGKIYNDGDIIISEGDPGDCMYVIQEGEVEVSQMRDGKKLVLNKLGSGDFFGEVALFDKKARSATVSALGKTRVITVSKRTLLRRLQEDPLLAYRLIEEMSATIRRLSSRINKE